PGRGATFRIALPLAPEAQGGTAADDDPDTDESGEEAGGTHLEAGTPGEAEPGEGDGAPTGADRAPAEADGAPAETDDAVGAAGGAVGKAGDAVGEAGGAAGAVGEANEDFVTFGTKVRGAPPPAS
ncbi:MAG TPA: hypothetical protein VGF32_04045, partial [Streptosporangiaceae bacterium]